MLRQQHHLCEDDTKRLYRVLHIYSFGFQQVVSDITSKAAARQQLLAAVWKSFLQLWEEALQVLILLSALPVPLALPSHMLICKTLWVTYCYSTLVIACMLHLSLHAGYTCHCMHATPGCSNFSQPFCLTSTDWCHTKSIPYCCLATLSALIQRQSSFRALLLVLIVMHGKSVVPQVIGVKSTSAACQLSLLQGNLHQ